jgi:hypothetical protein
VEVTERLVAQEVTLSVAPSMAVVRVGESLAFQATVSGAAAATPVWKIDEGPLGGSVDANGRYTAPPSPGLFHVTAALAIAPERSVSATVRVLPLPPALDVVPASIELQANVWFQFAADTHGAAVGEIIWEIEEGPAGGYVNSAGKFLAPPSAGKFRVVASSSLRPELRAVASVSVIAGSKPLTVTPASATLLRGESRAFTAALAGIGTDEVGWSILEGTQGGTISASGLYTSSDTLGTFHLVATSKKDPSRAAIASVEVASP